MLTQEDRLLIIRLCDGCERHVAVQNRPESWQADTKSFEIA